MAKFLKSIFTSSEKKKSREIELEEDREFTPPLDGRRKLSISRSGRMKQNNKKRHELNLELYGEATRPAEKPKHLEYHVNKINPSISTIPETGRLSVDLDRKLQETSKEQTTSIEQETSEELKTSIDQETLEDQTTSIHQETLEDQTTSIKQETVKDQETLIYGESKVKTPEEEIDSAFAIIDKIL